ncbi:MAG: sugar nucleotide-binding protein [Candidatus Brocadiae bacterium]|nr:sugar nucleotide-binding protein [Candidatus Brocadiia bacterium]
MESLARFLITGITSIHGWPIYQYFRSLYPGQVLGIKNEFAPKPEDSSCVVRANIENREKIHSICRSFCPTHILHCAGLCDLDTAEDHPQRAYDLNVQGAWNLYEIASSCRFLYLSYDLIFSGIKNHGQGYKEEDIPDPLTVVGKTVYEAEKILLKLDNSLIVRLALPMGPSIQGNKGAVDWINSRFKKNFRVTLLYDEIRSTINTQDLGKAVHCLTLHGGNGILNLGSPYTISLHGIGKKILNAHQYPDSILEGKFRYEFPPSPPRMGNVSLDSTKAYSILGWKPEIWDYCV